jgi:DNA-binding LacI/PurR family transcriptional regulator
VSIIGFDDIAMSDIVHPPLTTLRLPRYELAKVFFDSLEHLKCNPNAPGEQHSVKTTLVLRQSTGPVRKRSNK